MSRFTRFWGDRSGHKFAVGGPQLILRAGKSTSPRCRTLYHGFNQNKNCKNWGFLYGVSVGVLEIKPNEMCGGGSILIYAPPAQAPYWPHPFPLHTRHPIEIPTRGSSPHNILLPGIVGSDLEHLSSVTSFAVWNHCLLCKL